MAYPVVNLAAANAIFAEIGIQITKHELGYYQACVNGNTIQSLKLIDLTHAILKEVRGEKTN
jgi:hypothetical protein